jgi:hypothetical protein
MERGVGFGVGCTAAARVHQFRGVARCSRQARTSIPRPPSKPKLELEPNVCQAAKGSHRKWVHPRGRLLVISGAGGDDAKRYQEAQVERALSDVAAAEPE